MFRFDEFCLFKLDDEATPPLLPVPTPIKLLINPQMIVKGNIIMPKKSLAYVTKLFEEVELVEEELLLAEVGIKLLITLDALDLI